jgi:hypothetical protein
MNTEIAGQHKCPFCRMNTPHQFLRLHVCEICRDQLYDFVWVSAVQGFVVLVFALGPMFFLVEEVLLFVVLIFVKHRFPPPWQHDHTE